MSAERPGHEPPKETRELAIPTEAEVMALFCELTEGKEFTVTRRMEDEKGLYLLEVELSNADGGKTEYLYMRKGQYAEGGSAKETAIHVVFYDSDGMPDGGESAKKCD